MTETTCATHSGRAATHRCEGCGKTLCSECVEEGHRLLFCRLCGEQAVPLEGQVPVTSRQRRHARIQASATSYSLADALAYPFRGLGAYVYWGYVGLLVVFMLVQFLVPIAGGLIIFIPQAIVALLLPGFLFTIARSSAQGNDELPDWPSFDFFHNLWELILFALIGILCLIPAYLLLTAFGCRPMAVLVGEASALPCITGIVLGFAFGVALWIPAFGATALFESGWLLPRVDLHLRAALADLGEFTAMALVVGVLFVVSRLLPLVLSLFPLVGDVLGVAVGVYGLFTGAHLAGVYFRRNYGEIESIYLG